MPSANPNIPLWVVDPDAPLPKTFGAFTIHARLPSSGPDVVLDASSKDGERLALKLIRPFGEVEYRKSKRDQFLSETERLKHFEHPGIIRVVDAGEHMGLLFLAVERVRGTTLALLAHRKLLKFPLIFSIGVQLADTLRHLHRAAYVVRDLQPTNTFINTEGRPVLTALVTSVVAEVVSSAAGSAVIGRPGFIAPELFDGESPSSSSDQYALGRLLLSLHAPEFLAKTVKGDDLEVHSLRKIEIDWSKYSDEHRTLRPILERMTKAHPTNRYPSMSGCIADFSRLAKKIALKGERVLKGNVKLEEQPDDNMPVHFKAASVLASPKKGDSGPAFDTFEYQMTESSSVPLLYSPSDLEATNQDRPSKEITMKGLFEEETAHGETRRAMILGGDEEDEDFESTLPYKPDLKHGAVPQVGTESEALTVLTKDHPELAPFDLMGAEQTDRSNPSAPVISEPEVSVVEPVQRRSTPTSRARRLLDVEETVDGKAPTESDQVTFDEGRSDYIVRRLGEEALEAEEAEQAISLAVDIEQTEDSESGMPPLGSLEKETHEMPAHEAEGAKRSPILSRANVYEARLVSMTSASAVGGQNLLDPASPTDAAVAAVGAPGKDSSVAPTQIDPDLVEESDEVVSSPGFVLDDPPPLFIDDDTGQELSAEADRAPEPMSPIRMFLLGGIGFILAVGIVLVAMWLSGGL